MSPLPGSTSSQLLSCECGGMCPLCGGFAPITSIETVPSISKRADTNPLKLPARASPLLLHSAAAPLPLHPGRMIPSRARVDTF